MDKYLDYYINHAKHISILKIDNRTVEVSLGERTFLIKARFEDEGLLLPDYHFRKLDIIQTQ